MFIKPSTNIMKHIYMIQALGHGQYEQKKCSCIESQKTFTTSTAGGGGGGGKLFAWMFSMLLFTLNCENYDPLVRDPGLFVRQLWLHSKNK